MVAEGGGGGAGYSNPLAQVQEEGYRYSSSELSTQQGKAAH